MPSPVTAPRITRADKTLLTAGLLFAAVANVRAAPIFFLNDTGGIYSLNTSTGVATPYVSTPAAAAGKLNAFAFDPGRNNFYYANNTDRKLYAVSGPGVTPTSDTGSASAATAVDYSSSTALLTLPAGTYSDALFYNHSYWSVKDNSTTLLQVDLTDPLAPVTRTYSIMGQSNLSFGDIAVSEQGRVYGAAQGNFFRFDLAGLSPSATKVWATTITTDSPNLQLAFNEGQLYGVATDTDQVFHIDTFDGYRTPVTTLTNPNLKVQDAAGFIPEPAALAPLALTATFLLRPRRRSS